MMSQLCHGRPSAGRTPVARGKPEKTVTRSATPEGVSLDFSGKLIFGAGTRRLALDGEIGHARRVNAPPDSP